MKLTRPPQKTRLCAMLAAMALASCFPIFTELATNSVGLELATISAGTLVMGEDHGGDWDERPAHRVTLTRSFSISTTGHLPNPSIPP